MYLKILPASCLFILSALVQAEPLLQFADLESTPASGVLVLPTDPTMSLPEQVGDTSARKLAERAVTARFKADMGETLTLYDVGGYERVILVGTGNEPLDALGLQDLGGTIVSATGQGAPDVANIVFTLITENVPHPAAQIALGMKLGSYPARCAPSR